MPPIHLGIGATASMASPGSKVAQCGGEVGPVAGPKVGTTAGTVAVGAARRGELQQRTNPRQGILAIQLFAGYE
jgi:hypothetical protein